MRVTGGALRGSSLAGAPRGVRPTADRVRESLFARLDVTDADVLDLFAGTGALGIEALSRGASSAVFVDRASSSLSVLKANLAKLKLNSSSRVVSGEVARELPRLARRGERFHLVLADPPYASGELARVLPEIARVLAPEGLVVVEASRHHPVSDVEGLERLDERQYGDTVVVRFSAPTVGDGGGRVTPGGRFSR